MIELIRYEFDVGEVQLCFFFLLNRLPVCVCVRRTQQKKISLIFPTSLPIAQ
jgi:hypothetical protein